jgi:hypothetical protein
MALLRHGMVCYQHDWAAPSPATCQFQREYKTPDASCWLHARLQLPEVSGVEVFLIDD